MEKSLSCFKHRLKNLPSPLAHCPKGQKFINDMFVKLFLACDPFINMKSPNAALATERLESYFAQLKLTWVPSSTSSLEQSLRSSSGHATPGFLGHLGYHIGIIAVPFSCAYKYRRTHFLNKNAYVGYCNWSTYVHLQIIKTKILPNQRFRAVGIWYILKYPMQHALCIVVIWCQDTGLGRCCQRCEGHCCALSV